MSNVEVWRAEFLKFANLNCVRVYAHAPVGSMLYVLDSEEEYWYGQMSWAGGDYYVLSRIRVPDPNGVVVVEGTLPDGSKVSVKKEVTYR